MQRWEYLTLSVRLQHTEFVVDQISTTHKKTFAKASRLEDLLNQLGDEGWEAMSTLPYASHMVSGISGIVILKRPKLD